MRACLLALAILGVARVAAADDKAECIEAFDKAQVLEKQHRLGGAREQLLVCARPSCPVLVSKDCDALLEQVESDMPSIVISATSAGADVTTVKVMVDGAQVASSLDGRPLAIDPGAHTLRLEMDGASPVELGIEANPGEKNRPVAVVFQKLETGAPAKVPLPTQPESHVAAPPPETPAGGLTALKWAGMGTGALGLVGVAVGIAFGVQTTARWHEAQNECTTAGAKGCLPGSSAYASRDQAYTAGTVSTVAFIAGGLLVATGATLFLVPSKQGSASVALVPGLGGFGAIGRF